MGRAVFIFTGSKFTEKGHVKYFKDIFVYFELCDIIPFHKYFKIRITGVDLLLLV